MNLWNDRVARVTLAGALLAIMLAASSAALALGGSGDAGAPTPVTGPSRHPGATSR